LPADVKDPNDKFKLPNTDIRYLYLELVVN